MVGIELEHLAEGTLSFKIPKAVNLPHALVEKFLCLGRISGDGEGHIAGGAHQIRGLARAFV